MNCYTLFIIVSIREYKKLTPEQKIEVITKNFGFILEDHDKTDYRAIDIANSKWTSCPKSINMAWFLLKSY